MIGWDSTQVLDFPDAAEGDGSVVAMRWREVAVPDSAPLPPPRDGHAAVVVGDKLLVFGGGGAAGAGGLCPPDAVEVLDLAQSEWGLVEASGAGPTLGRGVHAHGAGDRGDVVVIDSRGDGFFNDVFVLSTARDALAWTKLALDWRSDWTMIPGTRANHCSCANASRGQVFIFGGEESSGVVNNALLVLDVAAAVGLAPDTNAPDVASIWRRDS